MPRKSNADMIAALEAKLAEAKAKEADKSKAEVETLVVDIKALQAKSAELVEGKAAAIAKVTEAWDARIAKVEQKLMDKEARLSELATTDATQLTFTSVEVEEV